MTPDRMMLHRMALELKKFVREVETQMSTREFLDWLDYFKRIEAHDAGLPFDEYAAMEPDAIEATLGIR